MDYSTVIKLIKQKFDDKGNQVEIPLIKGEKILKLKLPMVE